MAKISDYIDALKFIAYEKTVLFVKNIINKSKTPDLALWLGEGADAYDGGTPNISDRYASGFLWV